MLVLFLVAADWTAWYEAQVQLRSQPPKAEHQRWMSNANAECQEGNITSCVYMLTFRTYDLRSLVGAADVVAHKCEAGDKETCEAALKVANLFPVVYYDHRFGLTRDRFPQEIYRATCLRYGLHCSNFDVKACREDKRCTLTEEETMLIELRQGLALTITDAAVRAIAKDCGQDVATCRPKDMSFFKRDCPAGSGCFIAAYDAFLRTTAQTQEAELYGVIANAAKDTPPSWLADTRMAQCLRGRACEDKKLDANEGKLLGELKALNPAAVQALDVNTHPATAIVLNEVVEQRVLGNAKLAAAMATLESKRGEFMAARKAKAHEASTVKAQLPPPRTATQSAMFAFIQEREADIAQRVARYE